MSATKNNIGGTCGGWRWLLQTMWCFLRWFVTSAPPMHGLQQYHNENFNNKYVYTRTRKGCLLAVIAHVWVRSVLVEVFVVSFSVLVEHRSSVGRDDGTQSDRPSGNNTLLSLVDERNGWVLIFGEGPTQHVLRKSKYTTVVDGNIKSAWCSCLCPDGPYISFPSGMLYVSADGISLSPLRSHAGLFFLCVFADYLNKNISFFFFSEHKKHYF